jgi:hypothetical protein
MTTVLQRSHDNPEALTKKCKTEWDLQEDEISIEEASESLITQGAQGPPHEGA